MPVRPSSGRTAAFPPPGPALSLDGFLLGAPASGENEATDHHDDCSDGDPYQGRNPAAVTRAGRRRDWPDVQVRVVAVLEQDRAALGGLLHETGPQIAAIGLEVVVVPKDELGPVVVDDLLHLIDDLRPLLDGRGPLLLFVKVVILRVRVARVAPDAALEGRVRRELEVRVGLD